MSEQAVLRAARTQLERHQDLRAGAERRRAALAALEAAGLPTPRRENWRYTDLKSLAARQLDFVPPPPDAAATAAARARLAAAGLANAERLVLVDGHLVPEVGPAPALAGLEVLTGAAPAARSTHSGEHSAQHPLANLNMAFAQHETVVRVAAGQRVSAPLELVLVASGRPDLAPQPRVTIELQAGAELTLVQRLLDCGSPAHWVNSVIRIEQAAGSRLNLYRLQEHGPELTHTALLTAVVEEDALLTIGFVDLGGRLVRNDLDVCLRADGAAVDMFGVFLAASGQHVDDHTRIDHMGKRTRSDENFRGIVGERGRGIFNGKVVVHRNANGTDARQSNDNLLLGDHAEVDTKPELEIYAEDVKCSHGSTVGELDTDQLFYMRSRGLDEPAARSLLTTAFASSVLERIADGALRASFVARVTERLQAMAETSR